MFLLRWIGRVVTGAGRLAAAAFIGVVTLFGAALDGALGIASRLYDRFDARYAASAREARERRAGEGRRTVDPVEPRQILPARADPRGTRACSGRDDPAAQSWASGQ